jgi:hypothetical protein
MKLLNAISIGMFNHLGPISLHIEPIQHTVANELFDRMGLESCIGHEGTARIASRILGRPVAMNRITSKLEENESAIVVQYIGERLPEGVTKVDDEAKFELFIIRPVSLAF